KRQAVFDLMPESANRSQRAEEAYTEFKRDLARRFREGVKPMPGAAATFAWLRQKQIRVALNTGFDREITDLLTSALGWQDGVVDCVVCGDEVRRGRPSPLLIFRCMEL